MNESNGRIGVGYRFSLRQIQSFKKIYVLKLVATTFVGLEETLAAEVSALGGKHIYLTNRAVIFEGSKKQLYRANLELRTAIRVLQVMEEFQVTDEHQLYDRIKAVNWPHYFDVTQTFAVTSVVGSHYFNHSQYVALKTKDAIVDRFRDEFGKRPNVNLLTPHMRINIHIQGKNCTLSMDSSGDSLHKRGYRIQTVKAPINEVLAAGMVLLSGWKGERPLLDPMCGSSTIPIEAAKIARNIPANLGREGFGFQNWKNYDENTWKEVVASAKEQIKTSEAPIFAHDKNLRAIKISDENIHEAGLEDAIQLEKIDFLRSEAPAEDGVIIMNPPYDERLSNVNIGLFYKKIGDHLKQNYQGYDAWMISSNLPAIKEFGLRSSKKMTLHNGPLECKYLKYELYRGSKKSKHQEAQTDQ
ncbi:MAG: THUMP domain-containing protein [Saprospiraceae bacterium]